MEPKDELISNSNYNWINLAWELPSKGKKNPLKKVLEPNKDFEFI